MDKRSLVKLHSLYVVFSVYLSTPAYSQVNGTVLSLTFFINTLYPTFITQYNVSTISTIAMATSPLDHSHAADSTLSPLVRAQNLVWLELCRNLGTINGSGFIYDSNLPGPPAAPDPNAVLTELTTPTPTTPKPRRSAMPFARVSGDTSMPCASVNRDANCSLATMASASTAVTVTLSQGTLAEYVVVANVTFPAQPSMDATTLLSQIKRLNLNQMLTMNMWWNPFNPNVCAAGYFTNTTLWLIDDPVVGDHSDLMLGAGLYSLLISGIAFCFTTYHVRKLRASERYKEAHMFDFDEEDMLES